MSLNYDENSLGREFQCYAALFQIEATLGELDDLMGDLALGIRTISSGIDTLKKLTDLAAKTQNVELQEGILELREKLLILKEQFLEVKEENTQLRDENKALTEKLAKSEQNSKEDVKLGKHGYYKLNGDGPFCIGCYDTKEKLHRVIQPYAEFGAPELYKCSVCDKNC